MILGSDLRQRRQLGKQLQASTYLRRCWDHATCGTLVINGLHKYKLRGKGKGGKSKDDSGAALSPSRDLPHGFCMLLHLDGIQGRGSPRKAKEPSGRPSFHFLLFEPLLFSGIDLLEQTSE